MKQEVIEDYIELIAAKLPEFKQTGTDVTYISGADMKLTAQKLDNKGQPFEDEQVYELTVPIIKKLNHAHHLRIAWLSHGLQGVYNYIDEYLTAEQMKEVKRFFMKRYHGKDLQNHRPV
jgi:hypothetical protein